ncbi:MAG: MFS transporter [Proteobacteria bacterium]|nr:MFS transporter [Pseudomonadota bacterium]
MPNDRAPTPPGRLVLLMALSLFINYVDRGNLATAGPLIQDELHLSGKQFGALLSGFYLTYVLAMVPGGWLADRYGAKFTLGLGAALWSVATLLTGFSGSFAAIMALRLVLGLGETAAFPSSSKLIATCVDRAHIGIANGVIGFGYLVGPAVGTLLGGLLMARVGWRPVFVLFGAVSLLWLLPWARVRVAESTARTPAGDGDAPPMAAILRQRGLWGAAIGHFAGNYNWYFILGWLPTYLVRGRGFSMESMAQVVSFAYLVNAAAALFAGWAIDAWVRAGRSPTLAYKLPMGLAHLLGIACMFGMAVLPVRGCIACLFVYEIVLGFSSPGYFGIPQILAGPAATARWVGVQNMIGNLPGIIAPFFAGILIDAEGGSYATAFAIAGIVNLVGFFGWVVVLPRIAPIRWAPPAGRTPAA